MNMRIPSFSHQLVYKDLYPMNSINFCDNYVKFQVSFTIASFILDLFDLISLQNRE